MKMKNVVKKSLLIGIGAVSATKPKVRNVLREFEKAGILRKKQADDILSKVVAEAKKRQAWLKQQVGLGGKRWKKRANALARRLEARGRKTARKIIKKAQIGLR